MINVQLLESILEETVMVQFDVLSWPLPEDMKKYKQPHLQSCPTKIWTDHPPNTIWLCYCLNQPSLRVHDINSVSKSWPSGHPSLEVTRILLPSTTIFLSLYFYIMFHLAIFAHFYPKDGGSVFLQNIGIHLSDWCHDPEDHNIRVYKYFFRESGKSSPICIIRAKHTSVLSCHIVSKVLCHDCPNTGLSHPSVVRAARKCSVDFSPC
jgi:hypothetical protein